jgi:hypothetical protein
MKVLILGCGPAGLIAAHAAAIKGCDIAILSKRRKSFMNGAQYLHAPIPMASKKPSFKINYELSGPVAGYRAKVYGLGSTVQVSPASLVGRHDAWDIREAYDFLWLAYRDYVRDFELDPVSVAVMLSKFKPDVTISTIPAPLLCAASHEFDSTKVWATDRKMALINDNTVLCQGEPMYRWYRTSRIQGFENTEWPHDSKPVVGDRRLWEVVKPLSSNCTCFPNVTRMGRYGKWTKGVLSHEVWDETNTLIQKVQDERA